jgi:hypothetical protein
MVFLERVGEDQNVVEIMDTTPSVIRSWNILFIIVWKVAGLLVRLKYMTRGLNRPLLVQNAAFHSSPSWIWTLFYPQRMSSLVK